MPAPVIIATIMRPEGDTGVQTHFRSFADWLHSVGRAVRTITPYDAPLALVYPSFAVRKLIHPLSGSASVRWYRHWHRVWLERALRRVLSDGTPCVVYAQCPLSAYAALRARVGTAQRVVLVVHFNVSQADEWAGKGLIAMQGRPARSIRAFESDVLPRLDGLVFVSEFMRQVLRSRIAAIETRPCCVVPNFVADPGVSTQRSVDADLLCVGTLEQRKNQLYALQIVAAAQAAGHPFTMSIAGDGPDRTMLEAATSRLGIGSLVRFLGQVRDAASLFERHRACLHVARIENLPLTLIEALSRGVPVFAPAVGGVPEVFDDEVEGRYLPLDDAAAAAERIGQWLDDPARMARAGTASRTRFLRHFERTQVASKLTRFIDRIAIAS